MRYIDADALIEKIQETVCTKCGDIYDGIKCKSCGIDDTLNFLEDAPTADVVLRDEVVKIFEEIEINIFKLETPYQTLQCIPSGFIEEFKEKYTKGGERDG